MSEGLNAYLYALLDQSALVQASHLLAALTVWEYAESSARHISGDRTDDAHTDCSLAYLRATGPMDRTAISVDIFGRNVPPITSIER